MDKSLVSICIPTYNGEAYLFEALESIMNQTYANIEIVISDDFSSDETLRIIEEFRSTIESPIHIYNHNPSGIGANWNNCVKHANGKFIKFLFQDDVLLPNCIERMVNLAKVDEEIGLVYCKRHIIYNHNKKFDKAWVNNFSTLHKSWDNIKIEEGIMDGKIYLRDKNLLSFPKNKIGEPTAVLLNIDCFKKVGYFNTRLSQALDIEYWYKILPYFNIGFIDEELVQFRLHEMQASQLNKKRKTPDKKLLPKLLFKSIFWHLHNYQKKQILKEVLNWYEIKSFLKKVKRKIVNR